MGNLFNFRVLTQYHQNQIYLKNSKNLGRYPLRKFFINFENLSTSPDRCLDRTLPEEKIWTRQKGKLKFNSITCPCCGEAERQMSG